MQIENEFKYGSASRNRHNETQMVNNSYAHVTFFASQKQYLPHVLQVGDLIRVQKCMCKAFRGQRQFNVNVYQNKSEWAVFRGPQSTAPHDKPGANRTVLVSKEDDMKNLEKTEPVCFAPTAKIDINRPFTYSQLAGDQYTFHASEVKMLEDLRQWSKGYFSQISQYDSRLHLPR